MIKINKIKEKETIEVLAQGNCIVRGQPPIYIKGQDCLNDCSAAMKPKYYKNANM